ncbi:MAG: hypothetical protein KJP12_02700 [Acidimicrobiia bacterium]|nr:hypothetical protein [Acidimicrobiia bacterium]NNK90837.1 hypothetical protein [Acidimicrobiia bacterium]
MAGAIDSTAQPRGVAIKKLIAFALVAGGAACAAKAVAAKKAEWAGMPESAVRAKLDARIPEQVPAEQRTVIADKVVAKMRQRGIIGEEPSLTDADGNGQAT